MPPCPTDVALSNRHIWLWSVTIVRLLAPFASFVVGIKVHILEQEMCDKRAGDS